MASVDHDAAMRRAAERYAAGDLEEARRLGEGIVLAEPRHFYALHLLGAIAATSGNWEDAVRWTSRALELDPAHAEVRNNRGAALRALGRYAEALADYAHVLAIVPASVAALNGRGVALAALNRHAEAIASYDQALRTEPAFAAARFNRSSSRLMAHDFAGGWADYEARWEGSDRPTPRRAFAAAQLQDWDRGATVALWTEQGIGDQLLFSSLVGEVAALGQPFVLEVDPRLMPAFSRAHPGWRLVAGPAPAAAFAGCDRHLPIGSLPRLLRPTLASFARQPQSFLAADGVRVAAYRSRLAEGDAKVVGISWRTFQPHKRSYYERRKSAALEAFHDLSLVAGVKLVDLQYGNTADERAAFAANGGRLHRLEELDLFNDLDGLLAAIEACDLVVTTSNVTAHLAGALGKRTLLVFLGANPPFHYWATSADDDRTLWHPSVQIVSGPGLDTWQSVLEQVARVV